MTTTETIDYEAVFKQITDRLKKEETRAAAKPLVRIWNGNWVEIAEVHREISASFPLENNDTGSAELVLPADYYISKWLSDAKGRAGAKNVFVTVDYRGMRWSGTLSQLKQTRDTNTGQRTLTATFLHDYEHLKHIIGYANPFLPPELQFPKTYIVFGPARWSLKLMLLLNLWRLEGSAWSLPDDPLDIAGWIDSLTSMSTWSQVVKPHSLLDDNSNLAIASSRFKYIHDVGKNIVADGQLTWVCRRWLTGDPPPWDGAVVKHGCLVWDLVDNSGYTTETSLGGNLFTGLERTATTIASDGMTEGVDVISDPTFPDEYSQPGWHGVLPKAPGIILRDGDRTSITSTEFTWKPPVDVGYVAGGHSMPGVNEAISAGINLTGSLIAAAFQVPDLGSTADAVLKPLYTDTILAFQKWKDLSRAEDLGWSHFHEIFADGGDRAYTLGGVIALRTSMFKTREFISHTVEVTDGYEGLRVGAQGYGNCDIGVRLGVTVKDFGQPGQVWVDQVSNLTLGWARDTTPGVKLTIGAPAGQDPVVKGLEMIKEVFGITKDLGVL